MKFNRFVALALIALLVVGTMVVFTHPSFAQGTQPPAATDCLDDDDTAESTDAEDTDDVEEQCGPQDEDEDEAGEAEDANEANETEGADEADEVAPANTPVTAEEAQAIAEDANPDAATLNVEFDREGGKDIWEVELDNGLDVKVDAGSGTILHTENRD